MNTSLDRTRVAPTPWFVAIGASGGDGLVDIKDLLRGLPADLEAIILVVLHRAWDRVSHLRAALAHASPFPVVIAEDGERFRTGTVYIGEPGDHLKLAAASLGEILRDPQQLYTEQDGRSPLQLRGCVRKREVHRDRSVRKPRRRIPWARRDPQGGRPHDGGAAAARTAGDAGERDRLRRPDKRDRRCCHDRSGDHGSDESLAFG